MTNEQRLDCPLIDPDMWASMSVRSTETRTVMDARSEKNASDELGRHQSRGLLEGSAYTRVLNHRGERPGRPCLVRCRETERRADESGSAPSCNCPSSSQVSPARVAGREGSHGLPLAGITPQFVSLSMSAVPLQDDWQFNALDDAPSVDGRDTNIDLLS